MTAIERIKDYVTAAKTDYAEARSDFEIDEAGDRLQYKLFLSDLTEVIEARTTPRLRILELPMEQAGEYNNTPYALILDRAQRLTHEDIPQAFADAAKTIGAVGVLIFDSEIDIE